MTTTELDRLTQPREVTQATAVEQARAVAEVAAAVRVAQDNPRRVETCIAAMRQACTQRTLADRAFYSLPRAGGRIEGKTVHLARELASCWTNMDYGLRELKRDDIKGESEILAWAWDQERNLRASRSFIVPHARMAKRNGRKVREALDDLADITNNNNSVGSRAQREVIFQVLPEWFVAEAEELAAKTLQDGGSKTLAQQKADALGHFADTYGVTQEQLEAYLQRPAKDWTAQTLGALRVLSGELSRGEKRVQDEFASDQGETSKSPSSKVTADEVAALTKTDDEPHIPEPEPGDWGDTSGDE